ncbi:hypothetical protein, partial [Cryobacterium sp. TMS1-13-1]|uniref:hypothetical protein n=1 Tax=Cryobacterium sp. TMS1-13-1 TaxID=1259220 RepID=UPI001A7E11FA
MIDPDDAGWGWGWGWGCGSCAEPFWMLAVVSLQSEVAREMGPSPRAIVDFLRREQRDAGVFVAGVIPRHVVVQVVASGLKA